MIMQPLPIQAFFGGDMLRHDSDDNSNIVYKDKFWGSDNVLVSLNDYRERKTGQIMRQKLGEFASDPMFLAEMDKAQELYFTGLSSDIIEENNELIIERCFEWFIFDYVMKNGLTLLDMYIAKKTVADKEIEMINEWSASRQSLYVVCNVSSNGRLKIRDLVLNRKFVVENYEVPGKLEKGTIVFMRVIKVGQKHEFSTGGLALPPSCYESLMKKLKVDIGRYFANKTNKTDISLDEYLKRRAHKINAWVMDLAYQVTHFFKEQEFFTDKLSSRITQQITDIFLDDYYDKWINQPTQTLDGKTPLQACKTVHGRAKVEEMLRELEVMEMGRIKKGEPHYDINKVRARLGMIRWNNNKANLSIKNQLVIKSLDRENCLWSKRIHERVAQLVEESLLVKNYTGDQIKGAVKLWFDYCTKENPVIRRERLWVATVLYTLGRLELDRTVQQQKLAGEYGVNPSRLSERFRAMCRALDLMVFDRRYISTKFPIEGLELSDPLLANIFKRIKL